METVLKQSGYPLKVLATNLGINRDTIHDKFKEHDLSYDFIAKVGELIHYNFAYEYPEVKNAVKITLMTPRETIKKDIYLKVNSSLTSQRSLHAMQKQNFYKTKVSQTLSMVKRLYVFRLRNYPSKRT